MLRSIQLIALLCLALPSWANPNMQTYQDYEIYHNAFPSVFIEPEVAKTYGLQRGKRLAFVNIAVLKVQKDGKKKAQTTLLSGYAMNMLQQRQPIKFTKIDEGNAIYYLGQFGFSSNLPMQLHIEVQPDPNKPAYPLTLRQRFYVD